jgi:HAD superfamily hydrolase (TIGR01484 family)
MKKLIIFDLDGTLTESKSTVTPEVVQAISDLQGPENEDYNGRRVAVISGCAWNQFEKQFISKFERFGHKKDNLHLMPVCGAELYEYTGYEIGWVQIYNNNLLLREKAKIYNAMETAITIYNNFIATSDLDSIIAPLDSAEDYIVVHGEIAEDRGSQITFSMLGQDAPLKEKQSWDPDGSKRKHLVRLTSRELKGKFEVKMGGTTSIDVTKKGINKSFGVLKIIEDLNIEKKDVLFIGDSLFEGGNDYPVKKLGIECLDTTGPNNTMEIIKKLLES